jgi:hypothetical protein
MPTATIDHLEVSYVTRGSGPALLMERVRDRILEFGRAHR